MHEVRVARLVEAGLAPCDGRATIRTGICRQQGDCESGCVGAGLATRGILGEGGVVAGAAAVETMKLVCRCCGDRAVAPVQARRFDDEAPVGLGAEYVAGMSEEAGDDVRCQPDGSEGTEQGSASANHATNIRWQPKQANGCPRCRFRLPGFSSDVSSARPDYTSATES